MRKLGVRVSKGARARRFRYHQAMLDSHTLKKKTDFEELPNLYIIFILEHDLFEKGLPIYFVNKILNVKDADGNYLPFDDGCNIMYINGDYRGDNPLGKLMHDFSTPNADEMYYDELAKRVRFHKQDEKGVQNMCQIIEEYGDERAAEALKQGAHGTSCTDYRPSARRSFGIAERGHGREIRCRSATPSNIYSESATLRTEKSDSIL